MAAGAVSLKKPHDIIILSFRWVVKGQTIYLVYNIPLTIWPIKDYWLSFLDFGLENDFVMRSSKVSL